MATKKRKKQVKAGPSEALALYKVIRKRHSDAHCELVHDSPFQLIVATVLSAQSTDVMVNKITPELFRLGASSLLNDILMQLRKEQTGAYQSGDYFTLD